MIRLVAATALATATIPFAAPPALAHGVCWADASTPYTNNGRQILGGASLYCFDGSLHSEVNLTVCLQYALVDVPQLYANAHCDTMTVTDPVGYAYVGGGVDHYCPFTTGYYRTHLTAVANPHTEVHNAISAPALIVERCTV